MSKVSFNHAFQRWYKLMEDELRRADAEKKRSGTLLSWEAADHLCGLAVEAGMKALMIKEKWIIPDTNGDYPRDAGGKRPHVDELWDIFVASVKGRRGQEWLKRLSGGKASAPVSVFAAWRAEHRYAEDGTVREESARARLAMAMRLKAIAQEEGVL